MKFVKFPGFCTKFLTLQTRISARGRTLKPKKSAKPSDYFHQLFSNNILNLNSKFRIKNINVLSMKNIGQKGQIFKK
ncbi:hypothetical protein EGI11_02560 [Chryseobacterium sp. H3056]|uniref:Uncharacterized protein n=1 Tax=Kaistella daneshvariae TaxID=2487074 RepID=A0A3N0X0E3_9FLAO|nr:hypothetical protein EGI11_02560 [Kaistella daneshvariae]